MLPTWQPPADYRNRAVVVLGGGVLGRRIGCVWASAGYNVRIRDPSPQQREDSVEYVKLNVDSYAEKTGQASGTVEALESLEDALIGAWLVIEAVPEKLQLKIDTFAQLEALAPNDCILASNSSSYKSSEMIEKVSDDAKSRILNMHYYMPPQNMVVELMTDGYTEEAIFSFMVERCKEAATLPYVAKKQSTGFIFNRLWAAVKRETLTILAEGVSVPEEIDSLWTEMFVKGGATPCKTMDNVGLDTVAFIESHYVEERGLSPAKTVDFLNTHYINDGKLGTKSSHGGLYPPAADKPDELPAPSVLVLDIGLASSTPTMSSGSILEFSTAGKLKRTLAKDQALPDGVAVDSESGLIFWTNMGIPGKQDGAVLSLDLSTMAIKTLVVPGTINTPKQLALDNVAKKIYFSDREGCRVYRCNFDGTDLETLVETGNPDNTDPTENIHNWCVGITVAPKLNKFFWTQKGPSKGGQGRIFCADISTPVGESAASRSDVECILEDLPEPIDLEIEESSKTLYWTDRGEIPFGNSLNCSRLDACGRPIDTSSSRKHEILTRNFNEAIGLKIDASNNAIYVTDLGGSIYRCDLDGKNKSVLVRDDNRAFTGLALL
ncbi:Mitochondrial import inner membrane translocase subunit tim16 [Penicillium atrosanguineum]|uniref:Ig-like domain-containing protein n=1 Tax=Penicillium atrosanguineum TaxID=1132637 RepID=A0A9W9UD55_9EURO|nr:Mitochondrial import inner membrane translocase subunit tim16 [Penicillium atrosanguineum]KAJ5313944.1 Mitochondrial import inner membrane translocase subunit tim16 [Penicillium atrosanguineum]KAJ5331114.1 hypothetical protein N7476_000897 [Penicillium atrosanguineum]